VEHALLIIQVLIWFLCPALVGLILLQGGAGDISSAFGGGGQLDSTLGVGASSKMAKITGWLAAFLFIFVLVLAIPHKGNFGKTTKTDIAPASAAAPTAVATPTTLQAMPAPVAPAAPVVASPVVASPAPVAVEVAVPPTAAPAQAVEAVPAPVK